MLYKYIRHGKLFNDISVCEKFGNLLVYNVSANNTGTAHIKELGHKTMGNVLKPKQRQCKW